MDYGHEDTGHVPRDSFDVDGVDTDAIVPVAIEAVKYARQRCFFLLLEDLLTLLIASLGVLLLVQVPDLLVFHKLSLAVFESKVVFVKHHTSCESGLGSASSTKGT